MPSAYHFSYIYEEKLSPKAMGFFIYFALFVFSVIKLDIIVTKMGSKIFCIIKSSDTQPFNDRQSRFGHSAPITTIGTASISISAFTSEVWL